MCVVLLYVTLYNKINIKKLIENGNAMKKKLKNHALEQLLNGSGINNIPNLNIISNNSDIVKANRCNKGPTYIGNAKNNYSDLDCIKVCLNDDAKLVEVNENEQIIFDKSLLEVGSYCTLSDRPNCNTKTTITILTLNNVTCKSKFPKLVGGKLGNKIVACNNINISNQNNVLWDNLYNVEFDPYTTNFTDEDEMLSDNTYRFTCKFNGLDSNNNKYIQHPYNRFHPIENYCASLIYSAHPDVKTIFKENGDFECSCGEYVDTRVRNMFPDNKTSQCSDVNCTIQKISKSKTKITIPYPCFTLYSPMDYVTKHVPCPVDQFTKQGIQMSSVDIVYSDNKNALIEHPAYINFTKDENSGVIVHVNKYLG